MALTMTAQRAADPAGYVDLGLPSGTLWKDKNESGGFYTYDEAMKAFGNNLPTMEQFEEPRFKHETQSGRRISAGRLCRLFLTRRYSFFSEIGLFSFHIHVRCDSSVQTDESQRTL
ncbi:MAG TPA: hypothetical protein O0Y17_00165 [Methanocorpusculum sp.]|nr:hypothetical protein [Methanocorpusculum sp.]